MHWRGITKTGPQTCTPLHPLRLHGYSCEQLMRATHHWYPAARAAHHPLTQVPAGYLYRWGPAAGGVSSLGYRRRERATNRVLVSGVLSRTPLFLQVVGRGWGLPGGGVVDGVEPVFFNSNPACVLYNMNNMGGSDRLIVSEVLRRE